MGSEFTAPTAQDLQGKDALERDLAVINANGRCEGREKDLGQALQAVRQDPSNPDKLEVLRQVAQECKAFGGLPVNQRAGNGRAEQIRARAIAVQTEFNFHDIYPSHR